MKFPKNKSAVDDTDFVNEAVLQLSKNGCVHEVPYPPFVVNSLSDVIYKSGKKRLILYLSELNLYVLKNKTNLNIFLRRIYMIYT